MLNGGGGIAQTILNLCLSILSFRLFGYFWSRKMSLIVEMKALSTLSRIILSIVPFESGDTVLSPEEVISDL